jgi:Ca2+-binding RTX toxin-like protein
MIVSWDWGGDDKLYGDGYLDGGQGNDTLEGSGTLVGGDGNDNLTGTAGSELIGGDGDDLLVAYDDVWEPHFNFLEGGEGNDTLYGSFGNDTYQFNLGDGRDVLIERRPDQAYSNVEPSFDVLQFGDGIKASDLDFVRQGDDLLIAHKNGNDQILVQNWFRGSTGHFKLDGFYFADDTELSQADVESLVVYRGTPAADALIGSDRNDTVYAGDGDDQVWSGAGDDLVEGEAGNDYVDGQSGNDTLYGGEGNDQLIGGAGSDLLLGGGGDDKYVYKPGDGQDVIDNSGGGTDGVFFSNGIDESRLKFTRDGNDLVITVDEDVEQSVRVLDHFLGGEQSISYVQPDGGGAISAVRIAQIIEGGEIPSGFDSLIDGSSAAEQLVGTQGRDLIRGLEGNDTLFGMSGNDQIEGGGGNDYLVGGSGQHSDSGNDWIIGGDGNDTLVGEDGNDTLTGGAGDDTYYYRASGGVDTIDNSGGGFDGVFFLDVPRSRLSFHRDGDDLVVLVDGDLSQQVRVTNHFLGGDYAIGYVQPNGGSYLTNAQIVLELTALPDSNGGEGPGDPGDTGEPPVVGLGGDDLLVGAAGNDVLLGGAGNDTLNGAAGNDTLIGGIGDDTYVYTAGQDVIEEIGGADTLVFAGGITFNQVASGLMKSGNDLVLRVNGSTANQVTLRDFFLGGDNLVETIAFETGGQLTAAQIFGAFGLAVPTPAAAFEDTIQGSTGDDAALNGAAGNDLLQGGNGNDVLFGDAGSDRLEGGNGDDILDGGAGNDTLVGGRGDDTYIFAAGSGQDVIDNSGGGADTLHFEGISFNQVASGLMKSGNDLVLNVSGGSDKVTIRNWFLGGDYVVDTITFASGGQLTAAQLFGAFGLSNPDPVGSPAYQNLPDERAFGTVLAGQSGDQSVLGSSDDDMIDGGAGNDILRGNTGSDYLIGGAGSDTYMFALGDGHDVINNLSNTPDTDTDVLSIEDIAREDLWLSRNGSDLVIDVSGSEDSITIQDWYTNPAQQLDLIQAGGSSLYANQVDSLVNAMAAFGAPAGGEIELTQTQRDQLNAVIAANWQ